MLLQTLFCCSDFSCSVFLLVFFLLSCPLPNGSSLYTSAKFMFLKLYFHDIMHVTFLEFPMT